MPEDTLEKSKETEKRLSFASYSLGSGGSSSVEVDIYAHKRLEKQAYLDRDTSFLKEFIAFLSTEYSKENIDFLHAMYDLQQEKNKILLVQDQDEREKMQEAINQQVIYIVNTYVDKEGKFSINIKNVKEIVDAFSKTPFTGDPFDPEGPLQKAINEITQLIGPDPLKRFKLTPAFKNLQVAKELDLQEAKQAVKALEANAAQGAQTKEAVTKTAEEKAAAKEARAKLKTAKKKVELAEKALAEKIAENKRAAGAKMAEVKKAGKIASKAQRMANTKKAKREREKGQKQNKSELEFLAGATPKLLSDRYKDKIGEKINTLYNLEFIQEQKKELKALFKQISPEKEDLLKQIKLVASSLKNIEKAVRNELTEDGQEKIALELITTYKQKFEPVLKGIKEKLEAEKNSVSDTVKIHLPTENKNSSPKIGFTEQMRPRSVSLPNSQPRDIPQETRSRSVSFMHSTKKTQGGLESLIKPKVVATASPEIKNDDPRTLPTIKNK